MTGEGMRKLGSALESIALIFMAVLFAVAQHDIKTLEQRVSVLEKAVQK